MLIQAFIALLSWLRTVEGLDPSTVRIVFEFQTPRDRIAAAVTLEQERLTKNPFDARDPVVMRGLEGALPETICGIPVTFRDTAQ